MDSARTSTEKPSPQVPEALADVAFVDIRDVCAAARIGETHFYAEVKAGRAPQPVRFGPRCTRWKLSEIRAWLIERGARAEAEQKRAEAVTVPRASKAGAAAQAKRRAAAGAAA